MLLLCVFFFSLFLLLCAFHFFYLLFSTLSLFYFRITILMRVMAGYVYCKAFTFLCNRKVTMAKGIERKKESLTWIVKNAHGNYDRHFSLLSLFFSTSFLFTPT